MLILPRETKKIDRGSHLGGEVSEHTRSKNSDAGLVAGAGCLETLRLHGIPLKTQDGCSSLCMMSSTFQNMSVTICDSHNPKRVVR